MSAISTLGAKPAPSSVGSGSAQVGATKTAAQAEPPTMADTLSLKKETAWFEQPGPSAGVIASVFAVVGFVISAGNNATTRLAYAAAAAGMGAITGLIGWKNDWRKG